MADELRRTIRSESYEINGRRYERLEDVPVKYRKFFVDANGNGIPDFFEDFTDGEKIVHRVNTSRIVQTHNLNDDVIDILRGSADPAELRCARCGYDLQGTSVGGNCPECGQSVAQSIAAFGRPRTLRMGTMWDVPLHRVIQIVGVLLFIIAFLAYMLYHFILSATP